MEFGKDTDKLNIITILKNLKPVDAPGKYSKDDFIGVINDIRNPTEVKLNKYTLAQHNAMLDILKIIITKYIEHYNKYYKSPIEAKQEPPSKINVCTMDKLIERLNKPENVDEFIAKILKNAKSINIPENKKIIGTMKSNESFREIICSSCEESKLVLQQENETLIGKNDKLQNDLLQLKASERKTPYVDTQDEILKQTLKQTIRQNAEEYGKCVAENKKLTIQLTKKMAEDTLLQISVQGLRRDLKIISEEYSKCMTELKILKKSDPQNKQQIETLLARITQCDGDLQALHGELANAEAELKKCDDTQAELNAEIARLDGEMRAHKKTIADVQKQLDACKDQSDRLSKRVDDCESYKQKLREENDGNVKMYTGRLDIAQTEQKKCEDDLKQLRDKHATLTQTYEKLQQEKADLIQTNKTSQEQLVMLNENFQQTLRTTDEKNKRVIDAQLATHVDERKILETKISQTEQELERVKQELKNVKRELYSVAQEYQNLKTRMDAETQTNVKLQQKHMFNKIKLLDLKKTNAHLLDENKTCNANNQKHIQLAQITLTELQQAKNKLNQTAKDLREYKDANASLIAELRDGETKNRQGLDASQNARDVLLQENKQIKSERDTLKTQYDLLEKDKKEQMRQIKNLQQQNIMKDSKNDTLMDENKNLQRQSKDNDLKLSSMQQTLTQTQTQMSDELKTLQAQYDANNAEIARLRTQLIDKDAKIATLTKLLQTQKDEFEAKHNLQIEQIQKLQDDYNNIKTAIDIDDIVKLIKNFTQININNYKNFSKYIKTLQGTLQTIQSGGELYKAHRKYTKHRLHKNQLKTFAKECTLFQTYALENIF